MAQVKNPFVEQEEAKRYNRYRPVYHHLLAEKLSQFFGKKISKTLDVACGTGHSTKALAEISDSIIGGDLSEAMLSEARKNSNIQFVLGNAEELPFADNDFDYLNISMAFQWLNQPLFMKEAKRVLKDQGVLGIDCYGFTGKMIGEENFLENYKAFDQQYMKPVPRNKNYPDEADSKNAGFEKIQTFTYDHQILMNKHQFINYLMTRSNFLELPADHRESVENRLLEFYDDSFRQDRNMLFRGTVQLFKPIFTSRELIECDIEVGGAKSAGLVIAQTEPGATGP